MLEGEPVVGDGVENPVLADILEVLGTGRRGRLVALRGAGSGSGLFRVAELARKEVTGSEAVNLAPAGRGRG